MCHDLESRVLLTSNVWNSKSARMSHMHRTAPFTRNDPTPIVSTAEAQKPCSALNHLHEAIAKGMSNHPSRHGDQGQSIFWKENRGTQDNSNASAQAEDRKEHPPWWG